MLIHQLSLFVENRPGQINAPIKLLAQAGIDLRALALADTKDSPGGEAVTIFRFDHPEAALAALRTTGVNIVGSAEIRRRLGEQR